MATTNAQTFTIGGVTHQVEDTTARAGVATLQTALASLQSALDTLMGTDDITDEIDTYNEIKEFLDGFDVNDPNLSEQLTTLFTNVNDLVAAMPNKASATQVNNLQTAVTNLQTALAGKVDAVNGKGLSTNDYTNEDKAAVATIANKANSADVYPKSQTYDKDEVDAAIANKLSNVIVNNIPAGSVVIIDDTTTGGSDKVLSAEQGKVLANRSNLAALRIALLRQLLEHAVFNGDVTDIFDALETLDAAVESITLSQSSLTFSGSTTPGATQTLVATTDPAGVNVSWSSNKSNVATVNNGVVTAVGNGTCVITASAGGLTATCNVSVSGILAVYEISLGTLSHVSVTDGNGDEIADGDEITEGSALTIVLTPDASHVIDTASVTMGGVAQTLTDGQDGEKTLTIASVSGDIVISASATYQAKEYMDGAVVDVEKHGMYVGGYVQNNALNCKVVPLDFGKFYKLSGYNWHEQNGSSVYYIGLVKDDGNGGYTNIVPGTDVTKPANLTAENLTWGSSYIQHAGLNHQEYSWVDTLYFSVLPQSAYNNIDKVYLVINTYFNDDASKNITFPNLSVKEFRPEVETMPYYTNKDNIFGYRTYPLGFKAKLFELDFGKPYSYSGYTWQAQQGTNNSYAMSLVAVVDGIMRIIQKNEVQGVDSFFSDSTQCLKVNPSASGSFTVPSSLAFDSGIERVYLAINLQYGGDKAMDFSDFTLTENS